MTRPIPTEAELIALTHAAGERPGDRFGAAHNRAWAATRARLIAEGHADDMALRFKIVAAMEAAARQELTWRQRQDLARWLGQKWVSPHRSETPPTDLTAEELAYIADRLRGANDPAGVSALAKIGAMLSRELSRAASSKSVT